MKISKNSVVEIHYTLTDDHQKTIDSSVGGDPLVYLHGWGNIVPGLENALEGRSKGEKLKVSVSPEEGYGLRDEKRIQSVLKREFEDADKIEAGMRFQVTGKEGPIIFTVVEVKESEIVLDGNHPLAGVTLHFDVEVAGIRAATEEELSHGHVHGHGGHHH